MDPCRSEVWFIGFCLWIGLYSHYDLPLDSDFSETAKGFVVSKCLEEILSSEILMNAEVMENNRTKMQLFICHFQCNLSRVT